MSGFPHSDQHAASVSSLNSAAAGARLVRLTSNEKVRPDMPGTVPDGLRTLTDVADLHPGIAVLAPLLGTVFVIAVGYVLINFVIDMLYAVLDPRIRHARAVA